MDILQKSGGLSAAVDIRLLMNGAEYHVAQLGPDFLILRNTDVELPAGNGQISLTVDGSRKNWNVELPDGISASSPRTKIS